MSCNDEPTQILSYSVTDVEQESTNHSQEDSSTLPHHSAISSFGSSSGYKDNLQYQSTKKSTLTKIFWWNKDKNLINPTYLIQESRPSNLPAKDVMEEKFHRKEYNAIIQAVRKQEIFKAKEHQVNKELKYKEEERVIKEINVWNRFILPKFENVRHSKRVMDLWWKGLPSSVRGKVWKHAIDNQLNVTPSIFNYCLNKSISNPTNDSLIAIKLDVSRTFPQLCVFQENGPLFESVKGILAAYAVYKSEIGYVQGMSFIGAILSLNMDTVDAFICFTNLLDRPCHEAAFTLNQDKMNAYYKVYSTAFAYQLPKVFSHFESTGLSPDLYLLDWLYTIYAKAMPLDIASRVWDVFIRDGEEFLFRTALGVLNLYQEELLQMDFVHGAKFLTRLPEDLQSDALFNSISQMSTSVGDNTFQKMLLQIKI